MEVTVRNLSDRLAGDDDNRRRWKNGDAGDNGDRKAFRRRVSINVVNLDSENEAETKTAENLSLAIRSGHLNRVEKILSEKSDDELRDFMAKFLYHIEIGVDLLVFMQPNNDDKEDDGTANLKVVEIIPDKKSPKKESPARKILQKDRADLTLTALQLAVLARKDEVVATFLDSCDKRFGLNFVLEALKEGVVLDFRGHDSEDYTRESRSLKGMNAAHLAAKYSSTCLAQILTFLKEKIESATTSLDAKNSMAVVDKCLMAVESCAESEFRRTPLHYAAANKGDVKALKSLLEFGIYDIDPRDDMDQTPLHVAKTDQAFLLLLDNGANPDALAKIGPYRMSPLHRAKSPKTVQLLLEYGANPYYQVEINESRRFTVVESLLARNPKSASVLLDNFVTSNTDDVDSSDFVLIFDFRVFHEESKLSQTGIDDEMLLHSKVLFLGLKDILKHPILESFLALKWNLTKKYFYINLSLYFLFTVILTSVAVMSTAIEENCPNNNPNSLIYECLDDNESKIPPNVYTGTLYTSIIFTLLFLVRESSQLFLIGPTLWLRNKENLWELLLLICTFTYFASLYEFSHFTPALGAISVLLAWLDLTLLIGRFPAIGIYIYMSIHVVKLLLIFFLVYVTSLVAFAFSFHILLPK